MKLPSEYFLGVVTSSSINSLGDLGEFQNATQFIVREGNANYTSVDGVLFSRDLQTLCAFPAGRTGSYSVPEGCRVLRARAFMHSQLNEIIAGTDLVILAPAGSYAEEWAGEHGIPCRNE